MATGRPKGAKDKSPRKPRTDEANKRRRGVTAEPVVPEGFNTRTIAFMMEIAPSEPLDYNDVEEMKRRFRHYLDCCSLYDKKPENLAAYLAIGVNKVTIDRWEDDERNPERSNFIKKIKSFMAAYRAELMSEGSIPVPVGIFWQKNYDGLKDVTEKVDVKIDATSPRLVDKIAEKYLPDTEKNEITD